MSRNPQLCADCQTDITPEPGGEIEWHTWEWYMVRDDIWLAAGMTDDAVPGSKRAGFLCIGCLEERLGRRLIPGDFAPYPVNEPTPVSTLRLLSRQIGCGEEEIPPITSLPGAGRAL